MNNNLEKQVQRMIEEDVPEEKIGTFIQNSTSQNSVKPNNRVRSFSDKIKNIESHLNSNFLAIIFELIFTVILCFLFTEITSQKDIYNDISINLSFCSLFFIVLFSEWLRRYKVKINEQYFTKYIYIGVMLSVFVLGVWYINLLAE